MKKLLWILGAFLVAGASSTRALAQPLAAPRLSVQLLANQGVRLAWPDTAADFDLEEADALTGATSWAAVPQTPLRQGGELSVTLGASVASRFFQLRFEGSTTLRETSPVDGESGVAVTRETILRFNRPLSPSTLFGTNHLFAEFGGRRLLSRIELSSDRKTVTLFYLENLPASARVRVTFNPFVLLDSADRIVDVDGDGQPGGVKVIEFDTLGNLPVEGTAIVGSVFASDPMPGTNPTRFINRPLPGVTITVDGMEETLRAVTDSNGFFRLMPCPAGNFFVHIDGRTLTNVAAGIRYPDLSYYPVVGKAWRAVAGRTNNIAGFMPGNTTAASGNGWIFLPLITQGTLQPVSMSDDTTITFPVSVVSNNPALAGVTLTVPANSLFSDNGTRGGKVGIAPVPPDRLPGPLPPGLEFPLVVTVQTDGPMNFDRPAPICFPNLPDPVLGAPLPAGAKQALISFNHDKGIWESVGSMTVSADGKMICTDPGTGILQPGWHGVAPGPFFIPLPEPPRSGCERDNKKHEACLQECFGFSVVCHQLVNIAYAIEYGQCMALKEDLGNDQFWVCLREYYDRKNLDFNRDACTAAYRQCTFACSDCFSFGRTPGSQGATSRRGLHGLDDPAVNQIVALIDQIAELARPFAPSHTPLPPGVQDEVNQLRQQADALAGGDSVGYLRSVLVEYENERDASVGKLGIELENLNPGNAPAYPVLYAASVLRPKGIFEIRGETGRFGELALFVPRDGVLRSVSFYDPQAKAFGLIRPDPTAGLELPRFNLTPLAGNEPDSDGDALPDLVEEVYGTDPTLPDSDGDGISDGAEVGQGTNPLDGLAAQTGVIATIKTPGRAVDVWAGNEIVVTAEGVAGVSVFNAYNGMNPILVAHVAMRGDAQRVAGSGNFVAVAAGQAGLVILDLSTPAEARLRHQLPLADAQAVAADAGTVYVGQGTGMISALDLLTGALLRQISVTNAVWDLALEGDHLYAVTDNRLLAISLVDGGFELAGSTTAPTGAAPYRRLFVGGGIAYATHRAGYHTFDLTDPAHPLLLAFRNTLQVGWKQIVANGSGLGVAAVGPNFADDGPRDVLLYDVSDPRANDVFLTTFVTPGLARSVAIYKGLAYVADDAAGLDLVNYRAYDAQRLPPTISLATSFPTNAAVQMSPARVTARTSDDVQVRQVDFHIDGVKVFSDGSFPFEYRFIMPGLGPTRSNLVLRARAFDTGGNATWSDELKVALVPDTSPPRVTKSEPFGGAKRLSNLLVYFNELMDPATLNTASFQLVLAGADGRFGTGDDLPVNGGAVSYRADTRAASLNFTRSLPDGLYRALLTTNIADSAGNRLAAEYAWQFRVADASFWSRESDGFWNDPGNWSTGAVPGPTDNVVIDLASADLTITLAGGSNVIRSLIVSERLNLTEGTLHISGGSQFNQNVTLSGGTLKGATVAQTETVKLIITGHPGNTLDGVSVQGDVSLPPNSRVRIRNGLTLTGAVLVDGGVIEFAGDQSFNLGSVSFPGNSGFLDIAANTTLTLGPAMVVRGKGGNLRQFGETSRIINQGLISADGAGGFMVITGGQLENAGRLESRNGASLSIIPNRWSNTGRIEVSTGGTFTLGGNWNNTGTINATDATVNLGGGFTLANLGTFHRTGGTVNLSGVLDLDGGTLTLDAATGSWTMSAGSIKGGKVMEIGGSQLSFTGHPNNTLDGVSVTGDLSLTNAGARVVIRNGLTLTGTVSIDNGAVLGFVGDQTFNTGNVAFLGNSGFLDVDANTTLTLGPAMVVRGKSGNLRQADVTSRLINRGLISADVAGGTLFISGGQFDNPGAVEGKNGGSLSFIPASWSSAGRIDASGGGALTLGGTWNNSGTINATDVTVNLGGAFTLSNLGTFNRSGGTVNLTGVIDLNGGTLTFDAATGPWTLFNGTIRGGTVAESGANLGFTHHPGNTLDGVSIKGDLELTQGGQLLIRNGLTLVGTVLLDNNGALGFAGDQTFNTGSVVFAGNSGFLSVEGNTTLTLGPALVVRGGKGSIGQGVLLGGASKLINQGLISADAPGGKLDINPNQFENAGTLAADGAGTTIVIRANPFTNTGTLRESNGGRVLVNP